MSGHGEATLADGVAARWRQDNRPRGLGHGSARRIGRDGVAPEKHATFRLARRPRPGQKWLRGAHQTRACPSLASESAQVGRDRPACAAASGLCCMSFVGRAWIGTRSGRLPAGLLWLFPRVINRTIFAFAIVAALAPCAVPAESLPDALVRAYQDNPLLNAERAKLRGTDENVPQALAGYRPQVTVGLSSGLIALRNLLPDSSSQSALLKPWTAGLTINQTLFNGFKTS